MRTTPRPAPRRPRRALTWACAGVVATASLLAACTDDDGGASSSSTTTPGLPADAQAIVDSAPFEHGSWSYAVVDPASGEVLHANQQDQVNFLGSTTKLFTVGTFYEQFGTDEEITTPVYATGPVADGALQGDLVLVGAGDFILGSRGVGQGELEFEEPDHIYAYASPLATPVAADPLAGLDDLAAQVAAAGITNVSGDVLVDDRLWEPYESKEGVVTSIMVNDNLLDLQISPGASEGQPATVEVRPTTAYFQVVDDVTTAAAGTDAAVTATVGDDGVVQVSGTLPVGADTYNSAVLAPDPAAYARALFIEALGRAGVTVTAPVRAATGALPADGAYAGLTQVASLSVPASELGTLVLKVSHNRGAESLMCLLAVRAGSTDCNDGLTTMLETVAAAGVDSSSVFIYDGEGSDPASATPSAMVDWLTWAEQQPWGQTYEEGLPDVAGDGSIMAKSGTSGRPELPPMPAFFPVHGEAGYMTTASGRRVIVAVYANDGVFPTVADGLRDDLAAVKDWLLAVQAAG